MRASPFFATFLGDHRFDDQVDDLSVEAEATTAARAGPSFASGPMRSMPTGWPPADRVTRSLLLGELADGIDAIDLRLIELRSDQMQGVHADLLTMAAQLNAPEPEHARMAVAAAPQVRRACSIRPRPGSARAWPQAARRPGSTSTGRSTRSTATSSSPHRAGRVRAPARTGRLGRRGGVAGGARATRCTTSCVRRSPATAPCWPTSCCPAARPDEQCGLGWIADGPEIYATLIRFHTGARRSRAEEIHAIGMEEVTEKLPGRVRRRRSAACSACPIEAEIFRRLLDDPDASLRQRRRDPGRRPTLPRHGHRGHARVVRHPAAWHRASSRRCPTSWPPTRPAAYYTPPAPDGSRPGEYHVNLHEPGQKSRFETASIAFHEAIPGHHLQLAIASERTDLPAFQRLSFGQTSFVEGWALYTERLAEEMGLYASDLDRIGMLASDSWRACRLVVDTGLHAMGWSRERAIDFMAEHAPVSREEIVVEVDRYIGMPGQALAYKVGQREILRLRAEARQRLGDRFAIRGFHDAVLGSGTVSLPVLRDLVEAWDGTAA